MAKIEEIWKPIPEYEGFYEVSNLGRIKTVPHLVKRGNTSIMCPSNITFGSNNVHGYKQITLSKDGVKKKFIFHRIVASVFIPNTENKRTVNHKNGIKTDNRVENLEWATDSENNLHSFRELGRVSARSVKTYSQPSKFKAVYCLLNDKIYVNAVEAGKDLNIPAKSIRSSICSYGGRYKGVRAFQHFVKGTK